MYRARDPERGYTLIELLIVAVIIPLVIGAIASAIIVGYSDSSGVSTRITDSHDAQISSAYFVRDIESATEVSTSTAPGFAVCPATPTTTQLLGLTWTPYGSPRANSVSYGVAATSPPSLLRRFCQGGHEVDSTLAENLFTGVSTPLLTNSCMGQSSCACAGPLNCALPGTTIEVSVTVNCLDGHDTCANNGFVHTYPDGTSPGIGNVIISVVENQTKYQYTLTAAPREELQQAPPVPPGGSAPALLLLGSGSSVLSCSGSTHSAPVTVYGVAAIDSSSAGSVQLGSHNSLVAGDLYTQNPNNGPSGPVSGTYTGPGGSPGQYSSGPSYPDPFANLPDPSDSQLGIHTTNSTTIIGPADYLQPISIASSTTLQPGYYVFEQGLSVAGNGHSTTTLAGSNVFIFIGIPNAGPGIAQSAGYSVTGNAGVQLTAMTAATPRSADEGLHTYDGIVLFQSRNDSTPLTIAGNGTSSAYGGAIYAPNAQVKTFGNGSSVAGSIVANSLACGGNGGIAVGFASTQTTPTSSAVLVGSTNTDQVVVTGDPYRGAPTGTVTFYLCGPVVLPTTCSSSTGTPLGAAFNLIPGPNNTSTQTSPATSSMTTAGTYCFAGYYSGDSNYGPTSDTSSDECFTVMQPLVVITFPVSGQTYSQSSAGWLNGDTCSAAQAICGTVNDTSGVNVTGIQVAIQGPNGKWWNGTFTTGTANFTATSPNYIDLSASASPALPATSAGWSLNWSSTYFGSTGSYQVQVRATDAANHTAIQVSSFTVAP